jgi:hypothetical protein
MFRASQKQARGLLVVLTILIFALAACSGGSKSPATPGAANATPTLAAGASAVIGGSGIDSAAANFANLSSYKFSMTWAGQYFGSSLSMLSALGGGASADPNAGVTISGTILVKPEKAADVTIGGMRIIELGGTSYIDIGMGSFMSVPSSGSSMADGFAPDKFFTSSISSGSDFQAAGDENKNGVPTTHFKATDAALANYNTAFDVTGGTWTSDVWIAKDGGYPVGMAIIGQASGKVVFQLSFDLTDINSSANAVTKPATVTP